MTSFYPCWESPNFRQIIHNVWLSKISKTYVVWISCEGTQFEIKHYGMVIEYLSVTSFRIEGFEMEQYSLFKDSLGLFPKAREGPYFSHISPSIYSLLEWWNKISRDFSWKLFSCEINTWMSVFETMNAFWFLFVWESGVWLFI